MDDEKQKFNTFEELLEAMKGQAQANAGAASSSAPSPPSLSDADRNALIEYLQQTTLFVGVNHELAITQESMDQLCAIGGGLNNTLFILKGLDALGKRFDSFEQLNGPVSEQLAKQLTEAKNFRNRPVTPMSRPASSMIRHVGRPVVTELLEPDTKKTLALEQEAMAEETNQSQRWHKLNRLIAVLRLCPHHRLLFPLLQVHQMKCETAQGGF